MSGGLRRALRGRGRRDISRRLRELAEEPLGDGCDLIEARRAELSVTPGEVTDIYSQVTGQHTAVPLKEEVVRASSPRWKCQFLHNVVRSFEPTRIVELGSAFGVSGAYLALAAGAYGGAVTTIEGVADRAAHARATYESLGLTNIQPMVGLFDEHLELLDGADLLFVDGNHFAGATRGYVGGAFERMARPALLVLDDVIGYSPEMTHAWRELARDRRFSLYGTFRDLGVLGLGISPRTGLRR